MSEQKPTAGRVVHFYGSNLKWHLNMRLRSDAQRTADGASILMMAGPFAATIVAVRDAEHVNLRVDYPSPLWGSEIVTNVIRANHGDPLPAGDNCYWAWPPRTP